MRHANELTKKLRREININVLNMTLINIRYEAASVTVCVLYYVCIVNMLYLFKKL